MRPTTTIMAPNAFGDGYWQLATAPRERSSNTDRIEYDGNEYAGLPVNCCMFIR